MTTITTDRKALAQALAAELGTEVRYLGVPSCAYQVGDYTIRKDGSIEGDLEAIHDFLIRQGLIQDEPVETTADPAPAPESDVDSTELSIPITELTPQQLINLIRILYSRQKLLAAIQEHPENVFSVGQVNLGNFALVSVHGVRENGVALIQKLGDLLGVDSADVFLEHGVFLSGLCALSNSGACGSG